MRAVSEPGVTTAKRLAFADTLTPTTRYDDFCVPCCHRQLTLRKTERNATSTRTRPRSRGKEGTSQSPTVCGGKRRQTKLVSAKERRGLGLVVRSRMTGVLLTKALDGARRNGKNFCRLIITQAGGRSIAKTTHGSTDKWVSPRCASCLAGLVAAKRSENSS